MMNAREINPKRFIYFLFHFISTAPSACIKAKENGHKISEKYSHELIHIHIIDGDRDDKMRVGRMKCGGSIVEQRERAMNIRRCRHMMDKKKRIVINNFDVRRER